jgi:hypothetical protein
MWTNQCPHTHTEMQAASSSSSGGTRGSRPPGSHFILAAAMERCKTPAQNCGKRHVCTWPHCARNQKPFKTKSRLTDHVKGVHKEKAFECKGCGACFAYNCELKRHCTRLKAGKKGCAPKDTNCNSEADCFDAVPCRE